MKNISEKMEARTGRAGGKKEGLGEIAAGKGGVMVYDNANCPVRQVLDRIGDKWSSLVILHLGELGMLRFNGLSQTIGDISQKMLTVTLRNLEADGLVSRKAFAEIPPRVEYDLTPLGESLVPLLKQLVTWADTNMGTIKRSRTKYVLKPAVAR
jgi:DNA-binding HxlR family transcriptional regulator